MSRILRKLSWRREGVLDRGDGDVTYMGTPKKIKLRVFGQSSRRRGLQCNCSRLVTPEPATVRVGGEGQTTTVSTGSQ